MVKLVISPRNDLEAVIGKDKYHIPLVFVPMKEYIKISLMISLRSNSP
jgi:hypothetical protein